MAPAAPAERADRFTGLDLRRNKRMRRAVRLMIVGQDCEGRPYREKMSTVNVCLHGCCYQSWHNSQIGAKVELQLTEGLMERSALVRARVRYVRPPVKHNELFQVGVEFDSPQTEWLSGQEELLGAASYLAPARKPESTATRPETKFPAAPPLKLTEQELAIVERVTITIERLIGALQGPMPRAADHAVAAVRALEETLQHRIQREVAAQLDEAVRRALWMIGEISSANARKAESLLQQRLEQMLRSSEEGVFRQLEVRFKELRGQWEDQQEQQHLLSESRAHLDARITQACAQLRGMASETLAQFRGELAFQADSAISEGKQRLSSSLAALESETHTACEAQRRLFEDGLAQATEKAAEQFRSGIKAHLYSSLVAALEAVDKHTNAAPAAPSKGPD